MATKKATTAVAVAAGTSVVSIKAKLSAQAAAMADRILPPSGSNIKLAPGSMTLPNGVKTGGPIEAVVVDFIAMNNFYNRKYEKDVNTPPVCFSISTNPKTMVPSPNAPEPQAKTCAECQQNAFGSADNGKSKACKNERKLAVLPPDAGPTHPLWIIKASPTASRRFDAFVENVVRTFDTPPVGVIATIGLNPKETYPSLTFDDNPPVPNPNVAVHAERMEEALAMLSTEPDLSGYVPASATKKKAAPVRR